LVYLAVYLLSSMSAKQLGIKFPLEEFVEKESE
jgi:hypothetical protein